MIVLGPSSSLTLAGPLLLGDAGTATIELDSNSQLNLPAGGAVNLVLGGQKSGSGTMALLTAAGSFTDAEPILIGKAGHGVFTAELNSTVNIFGFSAPFVDGGQATIAVDSSTWVNTYNVYLGWTVATDPPSTLALTDGGTMRVGDRMTIFQSGTVTIGSDCVMAVGSGDFGPDGSLRVSPGRHSFRLRARRGPGHRRPAGKFIPEILLAFLISLEPTNRKPAAPIPRKSAARPPEPVSIRST